MKTILMIVATLLVQGLHAEDPYIAESFSSLSTLEGHKLYQKANVLTIDTRDQKTCKGYANRLLSDGSISTNDYEYFCQFNEEKPFVSVIAGTDETHVGIKFSNLNDREQTLVKGTRGFSIISLGMMGVLYALPSDLTGWKKFSAGQLGERYVENVNTKPEMDTNLWAINWIGHPYSGAAYYVVARHAGFNKKESFLYSAMMSTFFWEYGIEAVSEVPSIQDLLITPILGSLLGEVFIKGEEMIKSNGGKVLNSHRLGNISLNLLDPAGAIIRGVNDFFDRDVFLDSEGYLYTRPSNTGKVEIGLGIKFLF